MNTSALTTKPAELLDGSAKSCDLYTDATRGDRTDTRRAAFLAAELAAFCR